MFVQRQLFEGQRIVLAPIDHEKDAEIEAGWTQDAEYLQLLDGGPAKPLSPALLKKRYENLEKEAEEGNKLFYFTIRTRPTEAGPGELIGFARLNWIEWTHGHAAIKLGIGDPAYRGCGYGTEALELLLRFSLDELNFYRLSAVVPEYNLAALRLFQKAGFKEEVRRRHALHRHGQRYDSIHLGLLRDEVQWQKVA